MTYRYEIVVNQIQQWIAAGLLRPGDRLASVREMSAKLGLSTVTVHHAYGILEDAGLLEARPRSGFYVSKDTRILPEFTDAPEEYSGNGAAQKAHDDFGPLAPWRQPGLESFGSTQVAGDLVPGQELYRRYTTSLRWEAARQEPLPALGIEPLRNVIAKRYSLDALINPDDVVVTRGLGDSLRLCLDLLTRPGDRVLVETPTDTRIVSEILRRDLLPVEIYAHPRSGVDPDQFRYLLDNNDLAVCIHSPNCHVPTGVSYAPDVSRQIVEAATRKDVPIIENYAGRDLVAGAQVCDLAQYDARNLVFGIGSFADTLGERFGLGWISGPTRHRAKLQALAATQSQAAGDWALQHALAEFVGRRAYDKHLGKLRGDLSARVRRGLSLIFQAFPGSCTVSRPVNGYMCWVRGPKAFDAIAAAKACVGRGVSVAPGPLFSVTRAFGNFVGLNLSAAWTDERVAQLSTVGRLLHEGAPGGR